MWFAACIFCCYHYLSCSEFNGGLGEKNRKNAGSLGNADERTCFVRKSKFSLWASQIDFKWIQIFLWRLLLWWIWLCLRFIVAFRAQHYKLHTHSFALFIYLFKLLLRISNWQFFFILSFSATLSLSLFVYSEAAFVIHVSNNLNANVCAKAKYIHKKKKKKRTKNESQQKRPTHTVCLKITKFIVIEYAFVRACACATRQRQNKTKKKKMKRWTMTTEYNQIVENERTRSNYMCSQFAEQASVAFFIHSSLYKHIFCIAL